MPLRRGQRRAIAGTAGAARAVSAAHSNVFGEDSGDGRDCTSGPDGLRAVLALCVA